LSDGLVEDGLAFQRRDVDERIGAADLLPEERPLTPGELCARHQKGLTRLKAQQLPPKLRHQADGGEVASLQIWQD